MANLHYSLKDKYRGCGELRINELIHEIAAATSVEVSLEHGQNIYKNTKHKCHLYWCLIEFIDLRYSQPCWYFRPSWELAPLNLLTGSPTPLPPFHV
jgi:hypothetical protein